MSRDIKSFVEYVETNYLSHGQRNHPTIRIQKIKLQNFKSVSFGEVYFACSKKYIPEGTRSDILGIYGQNGSGKTAIIDAISILKHAMCGEAIPGIFAECIAVNETSAHLEFTFDFQYENPSTVRRTIVYSFDISAVENATDDNAQKYSSSKEKSPNKIKLFNEKVCASGDFFGKKKKMHPIITTIIEKGTFGPATLRPYYVGKEAVADTLYDLEVNKRYALAHSESFIFKDETLTIFAKAAPENPEYLQILQDLREFSQLYLYVIDTQASGFIRLNAVLPFSTRSGIMPIDLVNSTDLPEFIYEDLCHDFDAINSVLNELIPGLNVILKKIGEHSNEKGQTLFECKPYARRENLEFPLRYESDGIIRIISFLGLYLGAFNDKSCTVAIDEIDAGIYEYLLGEMLSAFEEYGKGQIIFTSHNLRPLELISKDYIVFTTSNPNNRYFRIKGIGHSNNLRDVYLREILLKEQDEELYHSGKKHRMIAALKCAGNGLSEIYGVDING